MIYQKQSRKTVEQAAQDLATSISAHGFGLLHSYDFRQILGSKGFQLDNECRVLEVCNPKQASEVLAMNMALNLVLPCRISVYQDGGATIIAMVPPSDLLVLVSDDPRVRSAALEVETSMREIIDAAA